MGKEESRNPIIQSVRGFAVVMVLFFHTCEMGYKYFNYNFLNVANIPVSGGYAFFFVLTGYMMYSIYHGKFSNHGMWSSFMLKRLIRIYPLYWIINLVIIPVYFLNPKFGFGYETNPKDIIHSLLLLPYIHPPILEVSWSLVYIVFFYWMFSLYFLFKPSNAAVVFTVWSFMIVLKSFGFIRLEDNTITQFLFNGYHLEFITGMAIGYLAGRIRLNQGLGLICIAGGLLVLPAVWLLRLQMPGFGYIHTSYTAAAGLVVLGISQMGRPLPAWCKPLHEFGNASYSILLFSLPCLSVLFKLLRAAHAANFIGPGMTVMLSFVASLLLCSLLYKWIEYPLIKRLRSVWILPRAQAVQNQ
ncbi:acyltransferase family protein [Paenibacillus hamazuiensis]|uniref:acyltransferase family protein n=1 Tax=Paenibacillus hamazuiensis TaxID=2936508 RepID=UPI00200DE365|nr:acyltransferase [Paenibacillus hamazuiensis]